MLDANKKKLNLNLK